MQGILKGEIGFWKLAREDFLLCCRVQVLSRLRGRCQGSNWAPRQSPLWYMFARRRCCSLSGRHDIFPPQKICPRCQGFSTIFQELFVLHHQYSCYHLHYHLLCVWSVMKSYLIPICCRPVYWFLYLTVASCEKKTMATNHHHVLISKLPVANWVYAYCAGCLTVHPEMLHRDFLGVKDNDERVWSANDW